MHVHSMDVIPFLACAGMAAPPPVIFVNHSDHLFWLGVRAVDLVLSTRHSGNALCTGSARDRPEQTRSSALHRTGGAWSAAGGSQRRLGLPPDSVVLLTVARALKFKPLGHEQFPDPLVPLLRAHPEVHLVAVGPGGKVDWSAAQEQVPGRIRLVAETLETATYLDAADIYLDSFPFVSITSLLEAGQRGLPIVSRFPFGEGCEVMGADSPGLELVLLRAETGGGVSRRDRDADCGSRTRTALGAARASGSSIVHGGGLARRTGGGLPVGSGGPPAAAAPCLGGARGRGTSTGSSPSPTATRRWGRAGRAGWPGRWSSC